MPQIVRFPRNSQRAAEGEWMDTFMVQEADIAKLSEPSTGRLTDWRDDMPETHDDIGAPGEGGQNWMLVGLGCAGIAVALLATSVIVLWFRWVP